MAGQSFAVTSLGRRAAVSTIPSGRRGRFVDAAPSYAAEPDSAVLPREEQRVRRQPPYKLILHNDDVSEFTFVIVTVMKLTPLKEQEAVLKTIEAHETGQSVLLVTTRERAELYVEQFATYNLTVTAEPDE